MQAHSSSPPIEPFSNRISKGRGKGLSVVRGKSTTFGEEEKGVSLVSPVQRLD
jgi:hypothetical protein